MYGTRGLVFASTNRIESAPKTSAALLNECQSAFRQIRGGGGRMRIVKETSADLEVGTMNVVISCLSLWDVC